MLGGGFVVLLLLLLMSAEPAAPAGADEEAVGREREDDDDALGLDKGEVSLMLAARRRERKVRELCGVGLPVLGPGMTVLLR